MDNSQDSAKVAFPPPFIYLGFLLIGLAADRLLPWSFDLSDRVRIFLCSLLVIGGLTLLIFANGLFRRAGTNVKPWKPVSVIVDRGVYGFTRNPMYLGMALVYLGIAVAFVSAGALIALPVVLFTIQTQVIAREERYLERKFGEAYRAYKARVRRWL